MKIYVDLRKFFSLIVVIVFCGSLILILVCIVRVLLMYDSKIFRRLGCLGLKEVVSFRLVRFIMLYLIGGRVGTDRMLERVWGFTFWRIRRRIEIIL